MAIAFGSEAGSAARQAPNRSGVVLYPDASQPSPSRATRRRPAGEPQLAIHSGGLSGSCDRSAAIEASKRGQRSSNGTPAAS